MTLATTASHTKTLTACSLCGLTTLHPLTSEAGDVFCCPSCREVSALLADSPAKPVVIANEANAQNITLTLGGMWCSSCGWLVSEQLKRTAGVVNAEVSFIQQQANLTYDAALTNPTRLKKRIRSLGYKATIEQSSNRYTVHGDVTDWVMVPGNAVDYDDNPDSNVCNFLEDSITGWYDAQIAAGMTPDQINEYLSEFDVWDRYDCNGNGNFDEPDGYIDTFQSALR